ncbi:DUF6326 family protein [Paenibacillus harenae]|uniref:DUF6326 family protein n=1 Tax=Paenibacillus harenae TaxID=306543 RepID=UPI000423EF8E|nr:DUF6326 family protein [Paenibacillus harenae]
MNQLKQTQKMGVKVKLSTLWIIVMFNMAFADILSFITPGFMKDIVEGTMEIQVNQGLLLVFAILIEIPIMMIFLSRALSYKINRWTNMIAAIITIIFVIGGGSAYLHYIFFASIETICLLIIIWNAWVWKNGVE